MVLLSLFKLMAVYSLISINMVTWRLLVYILIGSVS